MHTGERKWKMGLPLGAPCYNFLPSVWPEEDMFQFCDSVGGIYVMRISDGTDIWRNENAENRPSFSTGVSVGAPNGLIYHAYNKGPAEKYPPRPNAGCGGVGVIRAWERKTGNVRWERIFDLEANNAPMMVERADAKGSIVVVPLGANAGNEEHLAPFQWTGKLLGLDGDTGEDVWGWEPPMWEWPGARGPRMDVDGEYYNPDSWSNPPVLGADGTMYCQWHDGTIYAFDPFTGKVFSQWRLPDCGESGIPVIGPGLLAVPGGLGLKVFRDLTIEAAWREEARDAGDPRAFELGEPGKPVGEGSTPGEEGQWGTINRYDQEFTEEQWSGYLEQERNRADSAIRQMREAREANAKAKAEAKAKAKAKAAGAPPAAPATPAAPLWVVVGGKTSGGIMVKKAKDLKSAELGRLSTDSTIEQVDLDGDRLHFKKITGDGPDFGWVSLTFKGNVLVKRQGA
mmetsp:Transcript_73922/g.228407  ORF Transcript_73922/g.228407 Transcript_73922/m.228407 type:complete len:456 (-) Transcript_73922:26-1393(-)